MLLFSIFNSIFIAFPINIFNQENNKYYLSIVIDDFGGYETYGIDEMLSIEAPLTCAVIPNLENSLIHSEKINDAGKEVILHMPMEACVNLPLSWYGTNYIRNHETKENVYAKLDSAFASIKYAKGFNIHIGSGVCQQKNVVSAIYDYAKNNNLFFLDSRTHENTVCETIAKEKNVVYLGCNQFLEPKGSNSYHTVKEHLKIGSDLAKEKGFAIVIGHVGAHGGVNTAKAIKDSLEYIKNSGIEIIPLSELYKKMSIE